MDIPELLLVLFLAILGFVVWFQVVLGKRDEQQQVLFVLPIETKPEPTVIPEPLKKILEGNEAANRCQKRGVRERA